VGVSEGGGEGDGGVAVVNVRTTVGAEQRPAALQVRIRHS
jgi:hypothetical protein